jgi:exodeoxyribonuclease III
MPRGAGSKKAKADEVAEEEEEGEGGAKRPKKSVACVTVKDPIPRQYAVSDARQEGTISIVSFNVNGLRRFQKLYPDALEALVNRERADVLFIQETKLQEKDTEALSNIIPGYEALWSCSVDKKGYAGTACFVKGRIVPQANAPARQSKISSFFTKSAASKAGDSGAEASQLETSAKSESQGLSVLSVSYGIGDEAHDGEGRAITLELPDFFIVALYVPNSGQGLKRLTYRLESWDIALRKYVASLEARGKPCIVGGDLNVAHQDIDIYNVGAPHLKKQAGTTPQERASFGEWLESSPMRDAFRHFHPNARGAYTWWSVRSNGKPDNKGLRLDYFLCSESMLPGVESGSPIQGAKVLDCFHDPDFDRSDHCPIGIVVGLPTK